MILNKYTPEEYAAMWGCDTNYDTLPNAHGDGALFYNFGSENQKRSKDYLSKFLCAIYRTIQKVEENKSSYQPEDLEGLEELKEHVDNLIG